MILSESLPLGNLFFAAAAFSASDLLYLTRFLLAALLNGPTLSTPAIAAAVRTNPRHRGNVLRFLRRLPAALVDDFLEATYGNLLLDEPPQGTWLFILDQTYCGHNSTRMQNSFSTSPRGKRHGKQRKDNRNKHKQQPHRHCHCFVFGLLLTPGGLRLPVFKSYRTEKYCVTTKTTYYKQTQLAAQLIAELRVPAAAKVVVLGDSAFDAAVILTACTQRGCDWIVTMNPDRVVTGATPQERPKVTSLAANFSAQDYQLVRLTPGTGGYEAQRRAAACRVGSNLKNRKSRQFWVRREELAVHNVGTCVVLYSTLQKPVANQRVDVQKVMLSSAVTRSTAELVELYDLRWQIELFFREMKSTLGLDRYRFGAFPEVENWVRLCLVTFVYLEWYRHKMLQAAGRNPPEQQRWRWQRSHGLCQALRQDVEAADLQALAEYLAKPDGVARLQKRLRLAIPKEYRKAA